MSELARCLKKSVLLISGLRCMLSALQHMFKLLLQWAKGLQHIMASLQYVVKVVLESTPSVLEIGACIFLVDHHMRCDIIRNFIAVFLLLVAACNWHVPSVMAHHYVICKSLSAACMQAFYPGSVSLMCVALVHPTFGKSSIICCIFLP